MESSSSLRGESCFTRRYWYGAVYTAEEYRSEVYYVESHAQ